MSTDQKMIKSKVGLLKLAQMLGSVSEACKTMGYSRDSFYRFKSLLKNFTRTRLGALPRKIVAQKCPRIDRRRSGRGSDPPGPARAHTLESFFNKLSVII